MSNNLYLKFHRWLTNIWVYFVSLAFMVCLMLGLLCLFVPEGSTIFHTFYLFGVNPVDCDHEKWELSSLIIGIIGILIFNGLLITAFSNGIERYVERIRDGRKRFNLKDHFIMIGYNHYSVSVIELILSKEEHKNTKLVILTSKKPNSVRAKLQAALSTDIDNRIIIYAGDGNADRHVSKLNIDKGKAVYIMVEGNEWENQYTQSISLLKEITNYTGNRSLSSGTLLPVYLFINETSSFNLIQRLNLPSNYIGQQHNKEIVQSIDLHVFNFYDNWARLLWSYAGRKENGQYVYDSLDFEPIEGTSKHVHLVIIGFNSMGCALLMEAIRICHYPNFDEHSGDNKSLITIIDPEAKKLERLWKAQYPNIDQIEDICVDFIASYGESEEVRRQLKEWGLNENKMLTVAICLSDPDSAMSMALSLPEELFFHYDDLKLTPCNADDPNGKQIVENNPVRARILIRQHVKNTISDIIAYNNILYNNVRLYGTFLKGFDEELLDDDLAICVNGIYADPECSNILSDKTNAQQKLSNIPYESKYIEWKKAWLDYEQTPETFKMATRYQTDHYRTVLSILERSKGKSQEDVDILMDCLASAEHRRWTAERILTGWRQAKTGEKRVDSLKIHTCILPHSKLPTEELIKDRNVVYFAPILVNYVKKYKM